MVLKLDIERTASGGRPALQFGLPYPMTSSTIPVRDIEMTTLANGVRVISEAMPHVRSVSVGIWVGAGSRRDWYARADGRRAGGASR